MSNWTDDQIVGAVFAAQYLALWVLVASSFVFNRRKK